MASRISKNEISYLTNFQKTLHNSEDGKDITSDFAVSEAPKAWHTMCEEVIKPSQTSDVLTFSFNRTDNHFIRSGWLEQRWPRVAVKEKYEKTVRICWTHNPAMAPIITSVFIAGSDEVQHFSRDWFNVVSQHYIRAGLEKMHDFNVGNTEAMNKWTSLLVEETTCLQQPWIFNNLNTPFPLFPFKTHTSGVELKFEMDLDLTKYLRMQSFVNGVWENLTEPNMDYLSVSCKKSKDNKLDTPELRVKYANITKEELEYLVSCQDKPVISYLYDDIVHLVEGNSGSLGRTAEFSITASGPCRIMYFNVENRTSAAYNLHSNYTTNNFDINGKSPISAVSLSYGDNNPKYKDAPFYVFSREQVQDYSIGCPREIGYGMYCLGHQPHLCNDIGLDYSVNKIKLSLHLAASSSKDEKGASVKSIRSGKELKDAALSESFLAHVHLVISHRIKFSYDVTAGKWSTVIQNKEV